jgi:hypothetical protein
MDIFNPNHYLPRIYLEDKPSSSYSYNLSQLIEYKVNLSNVPIQSLSNQNPSPNHHYVIPLDYESKNISLNSGNFIFEFLSNKKQTSSTTINLSGEINLVINTYNFIAQLLYHNITFNLSNDSKINIFYITIENNTKIKNSFQYYLSDCSHLNIHHLSLIQENQYQDDSIEIFHSPNSNSNILYRSFTSGTTVSQVNSIINRDCENANTQQHLKHTLTHSKAKVFSKPNLEILNPNVTASHGNSIGSFSLDDLIYLNFRGIDNERAQKMIIESHVKSFYNEIFELTNFVIDDKLFNNNNY